ncbi:hypothetical protein [Paenibacillus dendritiformis]|uniref:hypothetical protein n=1 Tax=Paenibacillus dendritiformis TaxID=130049 RepID=UPI0011B7631A|nr:hypothetical protein [Paenibacillus dendritiformis]
MAKPRSQSAAAPTTVAQPRDPNRCSVLFSTSCKSVTGVIVSLESLLNQLHKERGRQYTDIRLDGNRLIVELEPPQGGER